MATGITFLSAFQRAPFSESAFVYGYIDGSLVTKHPMGVVGSIDTLNLPFKNGNTSTPCCSCPNRLGG